MSSLEALLVAENRYGLDDVAMAAKHPPTYFLYLDALDAYSHATVTYSGSGIPS